MNCFVAEDSCLEVVYRMYWLCHHIHTYKKTQVTYRNLKLISHTPMSIISIDFRLPSLYYNMCYKNVDVNHQVALVNGISMGGGASLMVPMKFSVVTEKTVGTPSFMFLYAVFCFGSLFKHYVSNQIIVMHSKCLNIGLCHTRSKYRVSYWLWFLIHAF